MAVETGVTPYATDSGWEGDSAGEVRASDEVRQEDRGTTTPTPPVTPPAGVMDVADDDVVPGYEAPPADTDDDDPPEEPPADETDDEREAREAGESKRQSKKRTWAERQAEERRRVAKIKDERVREERLLADLRRQRTELAATPAPDPKAAAAAVAPVGPDKEPSWEEYEDAGKSLSEFFRDMRAWDNAQSDAKITKAIDEARKAGREETVKELETRRAADREDKIASEFISRRDDYFAKNPGLLELGQRTIGDLQSPFLNTVVARHPAGMELYHYLAQHPTQARAFQEIVEPHLTQPFITAVRRAQNPVPLITHLVNNPAEAERISALQPADALFELGELVVTLRSNGAKPNASPRPAPAVTRAAPPLRQVAGRHSGPADDDDEKHPDEWSPADLERMRLKRNKQPRR
jgi:hypothetical protein